MKQKTMWIGLLSAALVLGCGGKKDESKSKNTPNPPTKPAGKADPAGKTTAGTTPAGKTPAGKTPAGKTLPADPGQHTGKNLWAAKLGGMGKEAIRGVAIDAQGNVAITGYFSSGTDFGDGKAVEAKKVDAYVSRYSPDGKHLWTLPFGGTGEDVGNGVTFDPSGNIVAVGLFYHEMMIGETKLVGQGSDEAFIAKIGVDGKPIWARRFGGVDSDEAFDVATNSAGHILVTGSFKGSVTAADETLKSEGNEDIFLLELDADGGLVWVKHFGNRYQDFAQRVAVDSRDNIVVFGEFSGKVGFGGEEREPKGNQDLFLLKLDPQGKYLWDKRFGSVFNERAQGLAIDPAGNIAITGSFDNEISFDGENRLKSQGEADVFVAKFDGNGNPLWSKSFGGARVDMGYGLGTDKYGNVAVGGKFWEKVDFGGGVLEAPERNKDGFLIKLSAEGEHLWSKRFGNRDHDQTRGVAMNADGRVAVAGLFRFTLEIGGKALESARKPDDKAPPADVFVAVFEP